MPIKINSTGGGSVTIDASNTPLNTTLTLPATSGTFVFTGGNNTIQYAAGSANTPSITRFGDTDTGVFFPANNTVCMSTGGTERVRVTSIGRVGIGTNSPSAQLDVNGLVKSNTGFMFQNGAIMTTPLYVYFANNAQAFP